MIGVTTYNGEMSKSDVKKKKSANTIEPKKPVDAVTDGQVLEETDAATSSAKETESADQARQVEDPLEALQKKVESLEDSLLRARADFQNLQRRSTIERTEAIQYANAGLMKSLLTVMDDFERSFLAAESSQQNTSDSHGFRLIYDNLIKALNQYGLETIDALHQPFDPSIHEALLQQPSDKHPPGTVMEEVTRGYRLRDRVIRPCRVIVSRAVESQNKDQSEADSSDETQESQNRAAPRSKNGADV